jgi:hypothetical protein
MAITKIQLYNGDVTIYFDSIRHRYTLEDALPIPSVTGILGIIAKPALINWAANVTADYYSSQLQPGVALDEIQLDSIYQAAKKSHWQKKTDAGTVGTFVHKYVEQTIKGEHPGMPVNPQLAESCGQFVDWVAKHDVKFLASEQVVYSREYKYVGTLDFICKIDKKLYLGDLKTSSGIWDEYKLQTAAYRFARNEEFDKEKYAGQLILRIGKDGEFETSIIEGDENYYKLFDAFKSALDLTRSMEKVKGIK